MARILLVDDDKDLIELFGYIIRSADHEIVGHAEDGKEALEIFAEKKDEIDIVLMDHRMSFINGIEATKEILAISPTTKVLFISADESIKEEAKTIGSVDFLLKPFGFEDLIAAINKYA